MYELPPILRGTEKEQITAIRDYLVRMARTVKDESEGSAVVSSTGGAQTPSSTEVNKATKDEIQKVMDQLRALIIKSAIENGEVLEENLNDFSREMASTYLAKSDFGDYASQTETLITGNANRISALTTRVDTINEYAAIRHNQMEFGYFTVDGVTRYGIAISQKLQFVTDSSTIVDGIEYYQLDPEQTMGIYTSEGWEFWVAGKKIGSFDALDSKLHVPAAVVDGTVQTGEWMIDPVDGWGVKYIGG